MAKVYDLKTKQVSSIPEDELAPGMVRAEVVGVGVVWINSHDSAIKTDTPYQHPPFTEEKRKMLRELKSALDEVFPMTLEKWEDGFRRDLHMDREIVMWQRVADKYTRFISKGKYSLKQRKEIFNVMGTCMTAPKETVLKVVNVSEISMDEAKRALDFYCSAVTEEE